jgi:Na+-transporting methylmalonyl-CoA/oxaloacetate decarboxylase gamma subunit
MQAAFEVFVNGISGVFIGLSVLYIAIKLNTLLAGREVDKKEQ